MLELKHTKRKPCLSKLTIQLANSDICQIIIQKYNSKLWKVPLRKWRTFLKFCMKHVISSSDFREQMQLTWINMKDNYFTWVALFESSRHEEKQGTLESLGHDSWDTDHKGGWARGVCDIQEIHCYIRNSPPLTCCCCCSVTQ